MYNGDDEHELFSKTCGSQCESSVSAVGEDGDALGPEKTSVHMREVRIMQ